MSYWILLGAYTVMTVLYFLNIREYRAKCKECEFLWSILRAQDMVKTHFKNAGDAFKGYSDGKVND